MIAGQSEFELNYLASNERSNTFQTDTCLADVSGLGDEPSTPGVDEARLRSERMSKVAHAFFQHDSVRCLHRSVDSMSGEGLINDEVGDAKSSFGGRVLRANRKRDSIAA